LVAEGGGEGVASDADESFRVVTELGGQEAIFVGQCGSEQRWVVAVDGEGEAHRVEMREGMQSEPAADAGLGVAGGIRLQRCGAVTQ
jgi:hypothetical protein